MITIHTARHAAFAAMLLLAGCSHRVPQATVEVIDASLSITPRAERAALDAVATQIGNMQRGDVLVVIPITGDAANDAGGHILRLTAPTRREAYDADLRRFHEQAGKQFDAWRAFFHQRDARTDILGALNAANQELAMLPRNSDRRLVIVSDFLEDDGIYNFVSDRKLKNPVSARELAEQLRELHGFTLQGVHLCLGRLESNDLDLLSPQRREAVQAFWAEYLAAADETAQIQLDGTDILADAKRGCVGEKR